MKAKKEWVDFKIEDLTYGENYFFTKESFEDKFNDTFEAVELDENGNPFLIWTEKYVITIVNFQIVWGDTAWTKAPRNPVYV
jgi:hypothetical protein